jgi:hypothetical protein
MPKRKKDANSLAAYKALDPSQLRKMYKDIIEALGNMPDGGTFEQIAASLHVKDETVWRRLSEVEGMGLIHRDGRRLLSSGKTHGAIWKLGPSTETVKKKEHVMRGKTIVQFSKAILSQPEKLF